MNSSKQSPDARRQTLPTCKNPAEKAEKLKKGAQVPQVQYQRRVQTPEPVAQLRQSVHAQEGLGPVLGKDDAQQGCTESLGEPLGSSTGKGYGVTVVSEDEGEDKTRTRRTSQLQARPQASIAFPCRRESL